MKTTSMPNTSKGKGGAGKSETNRGACSGLKKSNDMRSDTTKAPTSKNPFPGGLS